MPDCALCPAPSAWDDVLLAKLAHLGQVREKFSEEDSADARFADVIRDMLANIHLAQKHDVKVKVYQVLFEAERDFPEE